MEDSNSLIYNPIKYVNGEKLSDIYQAPNPALIQKLNPASIRVDELTPSANSQKRDDFLLQQAKDFMALVHRKVDTFQVQATVFIDTISAVAGSENNSRAPMGSILTHANFTVDAFAESKMVSYMSIKFGQSELYTNNQGVTRNPTLMELKSAMLDEFACVNYGQEPLLQNGYGCIQNVVSTGLLSRVEESKFSSTGIYATPPYGFTSEALSQPVQQRWIRSANGTRWRFKNVVFTNLTDPATNPVQTLIDNMGEYGAYYTNEAANPGDPFSGGKLRGVYTVEVESYVLESFLKTPYEKNKMVRSVEISPNNYVNIRYEYDTDYIANGMMKYNNWGGNQVATEALVLNSGDYYLNVQRQPELTKLYITSFDVYKKPDNFNYKLLTYEPTRITAKAAGGGSNVNLKVATLEGLEATSAEITIIDQTSSILGQVYTIINDAELYNGMQTNTLNANSVGPANFSTFLWAKPKDLRVWIDQTEITQDLNEDFLQEITVDMLQNKQYRNLIRGNEKYFEGNIDGLRIKNRAVPFYLLDFSKLNTGNSKYGQYIPNVMYAEIKTLKITYKMQSPIVAQNGEAAWEAGNVNLNFTPHVYKFNPYMYIQEKGKPVRKLPVYDDWSRVLNQVLDNPQQSKREINLNMATGGGYWDDFKQLIKDYGDDILRGVVKGVRVGEEMTRGNSEYGTANKALKTASEIAKAYGYGR